MRHMKSAPGADAEAVRQRGYCLRPCYEPPVARPVLEALQEDERLRQGAREAVSLAALLPSIQKKLLNGAAIAFVDVAGACVWAGRPVALDGIPRTQLQPLPSRAQNLVIFGGELAEGEPVPPDAYVVGEQPWWEPQTWPQTLRRSRSLRAQLRRAINKGVQIRRPGRETLETAQPRRAEIDELISQWLRARHMPPLSFVATVAPFDIVGERQVLVAELGSTVVGALFAYPIGTTGRWIINHIVRSTLAPNGTAELLVDGAMRALTLEGATAVTLGLCPLAGRVGWPLRVVRRLSRGLFDFRGLHAFKAKLCPNRWQRVLLEHPDQTATLGTIRALRAFAGGSLLSFAFRTVLRGPPALLRAVALLLIPWSFGLAHPAAAHFFPRAWLARAWIPFDLAVAAALFWLARRVSRRHPRSWLHPLLATIITADALLTVLQALTWNFTRLSGALDVALVGMACIAPSTVSVVLWHSLKYREPRSRSVQAPPRRAFPDGH